MAQPLDLLASSEPAAWLTLLADASIKGTAILLATAAAVVLMRRARAGTRHLAWCLALVGAAALPALSRIVPRWSVPVPAAGMGAGRLSTTPLGNASASSAESTP